MTPASARREPLLTPPFLALCAFSFLAFFAAFQLFPSIPFRLLDLGTSRAGAGSFLTVYTWASALSAPLTGALADRYGRRRVLLFAAGAFAVFSGLYAVVEVVPWLLLVACAHGFFWSGLLSASGALVADVVPPSRRTEGIGYWGMAPTAAIAVAPAVGLAVYRLGWRALMLELAALSLLLLGLAAAIVREERPRVGAAYPPLREALSWRVVASASPIFLVAFGYGGITSYVALLAVERDVRPPSLFFTAFALTVLATRVLVAPLADRAGPLRLLYPSLLLVPPALLLLSAADTRLEVLAAAVLFGTGFGGAYPAFMTWVLARTPAGHRAATFGSVLLALDTGIGSGSLVVGRIGQGAGLAVGFATAAGLAALALPAFLAARRLLPARTGG